MTGAFYVAEGQHVTGAGSIEIVSMVGLEDERARMGTGLSLKSMAPADGGVAIARVLLLSTIVTVLVSTSVGVAFEFATYLAFALLPEPRRRFVQALRQPIVIALVPFAAVVFIGIFYGATTWPNALSALSGWRRLLLLPLAAAVFDDAVSKRLLCKVFVITCVVGALFSFVTAWLWIAPFNRVPQGIAFHNYAVQGMAFSVAMIVCIATLLRPEFFAGDRFLGDRRIMAVALALIVVDVMFVIVGRSGYLSVAVMAVAAVAFLARGSWRAKGLAGLAVTIAVGVMLVSSPHVRSRVEQGLREIETVDRAPEASSVGFRVVFVRNTLRMIHDHPLLGVGTGGFLDGYRPYVDGVDGWKGDGTGDPHNQFLKILGEQGLIGFAAFMFFIVGALTRPGTTPYREIAAAALLGWCATSLANSHFSTFVEGRLVFFWLGAMLGGIAMKDSGPAITSPHLVAKLE
jgi:O-antigen ligase